MGVLPDRDYESTLFWLIWARGNVMDVLWNMPYWWEKGGGQMGRGGLRVYISVWCEKGIMRKSFKNASTVCEEIKQRACVHSFW